MGPAQRDARGEASRPSPRVKSEPDGQRERQTCRVSAHLEWDVLARRVYKARGRRGTSSFHRYRATMSAAFLTLGKSAAIGRDFLEREGGGVK